MHSLYYFCEVITGAKISQFGEVESAFGIKPR